ncbi:hypothetical protein [Halanaerobium salsuginis]|uniref:Uncharacterized protein n=1 Tax=Halanaerobium salsuginis TaxID=29563 RepID=A0A1I4ELN1_9FIRM|nr:hypothetical protein [Halanaerobium salsuginis]SFL06645.1 hypothetical protein SAMN02983006_00041 [Halanaerobium salsuginis]
MGLLATLKNIFMGSNNNGGNLITIYVKDNKCGNKMKLLFRKSYDIQKVYEDERDAAFEIKKVIVCDNCYNKLQLELEFDRKYNIIKQKLENGEIITEEEYQEI